MVQGSLGRSDPQLSPARAANAIGMSVRKLHMLFTRTGKTFGEWLLERRLEEARRLLASPAAAGRPIADIAMATGFGDLSTFYRAFRAKYGGTPGRMRAGGSED